VELSGIGLDGQPKSSRHAMINATGQAPVTGLGMAMVLERITGIDGAPAPGHGLYFVESIITPEAFVARAEASGMTFIDL
jgi:hypothetical protein